MQRPWSLSIIGGLLIALGLLGLASLAAVLAAPALREAASARGPLAVQVLQSLPPSLVHIVAGAFMLRGANWARLLYMIFTGIAIPVSVLAQGSQPGVLVGIAIYAVVVYFLTRPPTVAWFKGGPQAPAD
jgi:hypothetical protein